MRREVKKKQSILEKRWAHYLLGAIVCIIVMLPQINTKSVVVGIDDMFFFNRYYDAYMQMKTGNFNYFMSNFGFFQSGRVVNAVYGPFFGYVQGLLMFFANTWLKYEVVTSLLLLFTAFCSMKISLKRVGTPENFSTILALLFLTVNDIEGIVRNHAPVAYALAIMPLALSCGFLFLEKQKSLLAEILLFSFSMMALVQTHMLSTFFAIVALALFFIFSLIFSQDRLYLIKKVFLSALCTIVASLNVLFGMYYIMYKNTMIMPYESNLMRDATLNLGANLGSLLILFFFGFSLLFILYHWRHIKVSTKIGTGIAIFLLICTTSIMPWNFLQEHLPFLNNIQFAVRFFNASLVLVFLALGSTFGQLKKDAFPSKKNMQFGVLLLLVLLFINQIQDYTNAVKAWATDTVFWNPSQTVSEELGENPYRIRDVYQGTDENMGRALQYVWKDIADYLPTTDDDVWKGRSEFIPPDETPEEKAEKEKRGTPQMNYRNDYILNNKNFEKKVDGSNLVITWEGQNEEEVVVPVAVYEQTNIIFNDKELKNKEITEVGALKVNQKQGENTVVAHFEKSKWFDISLVVSIISSVFLTISFIGRELIYDLFFKKRKNID